MALFAVVTGCGCSRADPPAPAGTPWLAAPEWDADALRPVATAREDSASPSPSSSADSALLPQTTDKPAPSSPALDRRIALLWDAIVRDDPDAATPAFFPVGAYEQVKDIGDPAADWRRRLLGAYRRDIHALHAQLGDDAGAAQFLSFDLPDARARWVDPGEEWNKIGYFRVFGSKVHYELAGAERTFEIKSLISWRGEWFVVHLSAIK